MILYEDTRNKVGKHDNIKRYCEQHDIVLVRKKLDVGDYMLEGNEKVTIDTKMNLAELAMDLGSDKSRFWREVKRAYYNGIRLYILVEDASIKSIKDVRSWVNPYQYLNCHLLGGYEIEKRITKCHISYGVEFLFCHKNKTGAKIIEILTHKWGEYAKNN